MPPSQACVVSVEIVILAATMVAGIGTWAIGVHSQGYDYDEVRYAHSVWLASEGLRPYHDFLDCHPPYFALLSPIFRIYPNDPTTALWTLRLFSAIGNLLFLAGLATLGARLVPPARHWAFIAVAVVAFQPAILAYLVEFRIDGWGYALVVWSIYRYRRLGRGTYRGFELIVLTGIASLLLCPKLALLPPLIIVFDELYRWPSIRDGVRSGATYLIGACVAIAFFAFYLSWHGIGWNRTFQSVFRYNAVSNLNMGVRYGLLRNIITEKALMLAIVGGVVSWLAYHWRVRSLPDGYESALAVWLVLQVFLVAYPYKQYYAPWFLLSSGFVVYAYRDMANLLGSRPRAGALDRVRTDDRRRCENGSAMESDTRHCSERSSDHQMDESGEATRGSRRCIATCCIRSTDLTRSSSGSTRSIESGFDSERILEQLPIYAKVCYVRAGGATS